MPEFTLNEIAHIIDGDLEAGQIEKEYRYRHFHFDTRQITEPGPFFFAFKTETGDGHRFVSQLSEQTNAGAVVSFDFDASALSHPIPLIRVKDPLKAAHRLAGHVRDTLRHIKYIGVTGSAGKTTTKEFIFQLLSHKFRAYRSFKNWNNWIGMPFSLLNMSGQEEAAVFELAMSFPGIGEIDLLAGILKPNIAVILNVYPVHLEFLKTIQNAATAKSEIVNHLEARDAAFINADCEPLMNALKEKTNPTGKWIYFGIGPKGPNADIRLKEVVREDRQSIMVIDFFGSETRLTTPLINRLHVENLFVAVMVGHHMGMTLTEIQNSLPFITPLSDRGQIRFYEQGHFTVIDETYNSNPEALKKTLEWISHEYQGKTGQGEKIAVLGDMLELGEEENHFHKEVGEFLASLAFHRLVTVGKRAVHIAQGAAEKGFNSQFIYSFGESAEAGKFLKKAAKNGSVLLFKASRGIHLERAVEEFLKNE